MSADGKVVKVYYYNGDLKVKITHNTKLLYVRLCPTVTHSVTNVFLPYKYGYMVNEHFLCNEKNVSCFLCF